MMKTTYSANTVLSGRILVRTKFFLPVLMLLFASCKKESEVGIDVQPEEDIIGLYTTDTLTLVTSTWIEDSLRTDESPTAVLGHMDDLYFGTTDASVYTQLVIPNNQTNVEFQPVSGVAVLDSAVLTIAYKFDFYGDTTQQQSLSVYQMTDMLYKDSMYYSNQTKNIYPQSIGSLTFNPQPRSTVNGSAPHIRIPINLSWAQQVFAQGVEGGALETNADWLAFMNGIYIKPGSSGGSLLYFNLIDTLTGLTLYYHSPSDTSEFTFTVNSSTAYFSHYEHNYSGSLVEPYIGATGSVVNHVQANSGLKTKIEFPFLNDWYNNLGYEAAINKAELVIFGDESQASDDFPLNTRMFLTSIDSIGKEHLIIDMFETTSYYGGSLNTSTNTYKFNIARHIQSMLTGPMQNNGLYLKEIFGTENGRRAVLHGSSPLVDPAKRMYLRLTYTRIN
jgi:hypothetical protein